MLVFADQVRTEDSHRKLARLGQALRRLPLQAPGIDRHAKLVAALIEAGELAQGIADEQLQRTGFDDHSRANSAATALLMRIARAVRRSWRSGFAALDLTADGAIESLMGMTLPADVRCKRAEGFALYSLFPEAYLEAAVAAPAGRAAQVIGIRSIGGPLAAVVADVLGVPAPQTVRPIEDPTGRRLAIGHGVAQDLLADPSAWFALVDEGPGLSGGSFGAVADFLEDRGVAPDRICFFPSHLGPLAPWASERHRDRWARATSHLVELGDLVQWRPHRPEHRLESWVADLVGEPDPPIEDVSSGQWRRHRYSREADWPASNLYLERRKFLLRAGCGTWLLKFAGLGRTGARQLQRARALHAAGFTPEVAGYRHGFLVERWHAEATSLDRAISKSGRLVTQVGRYLGFRARTFPATPERGASLGALLDMARYNTGLALGEDLARCLDSWGPALPRLERRVRRVETDGRLHAKEWLQLPDGRLLKTDALDHHTGYDLVGCQDVAWDVAGAAVELGLCGAATELLCALIERESARAVDRELVALLTPCYLAFQLGDHALAADIVAAWPMEAERLRTASRHYAEQLAAVLGRSPAADVVAAQPRAASAASAASSNRASSHGSAPRRPATTERPHSM